MQLELARAEPTTESQCTELLVFADGTDELDNYLRRFERFATNSG